MKRLIVSNLIGSSLIVLACSSVGLCEEVLREVSWAELKEAGQLPVGEVLSGQPPEPAEQLKIENRQDAPKTVTLLVLDNPGITRAQYAITGRVRCEAVQGKSYLEMWSHFADGSHYFARTLAQSGLLQNLEGSCPWRPFSLPFAVASRTDRPTTLVLNVVFPSRGTVYLSPLRLAEYADNEDPLRVPGQWWTERTGGLVGGILGAILGCLGGSIGVLSAKGKARRLVLGLMSTICFVGVLFLGVGAVALFCRQGYGVWYPPLLIGILSTTIMGGTLPRVRRRYQQLELRKMAAVDAAPAGAPRRESAP